ncbi:Uncharacterized protein Fot_31759 [Forsythia ovata]|uniref:Uncharacterized protein n=1 Tax=Forsythia ovata TaxID=205694 RepID=A0ABD1T5Y8_9LAMI
MVGISSSIPFAPKVTSEMPSVLSPIGSVSPSKSFRQSRKRKPQILSTIDDGGVDHLDLVGDGSTGCGDDGTFGSGDDGGGGGSLGFERGRTYVGGRLSTSGRGDGVGRPLGFGGGGTTECGGGETFSSRGRALGFSGGGNTGGGGSEAFGLDGHGFGGGGTIGNGDGRIFGSMGRPLGFGGGVTNRSGGSGTFVPGGDGGGIGLCGFGGGGTTFGMGGNGGGGPLGFGGSSKTFGLDDGGGGGALGFGVGRV